MQIDSFSYRKALGTFATGVTVVTGVRPNGNVFGVTVNSFSAVSLDPPIILICLARKNGTLDAFADKDRFAVNILASDQEKMARDFAGPRDDSLLGHAHSTGLGGVPLLAECLCVLECRCRKVYPGGDHVIVLGGVEGIHLGAEEEPLIFFRSAFGVGPRP